MKPFHWLLGSIVFLVSLAVGSAADTNAWTGDMAAISANDWSYECAAHLLERAGFGGTPEEVARLADMGPEAAVDSLVAYESIPLRNPPPFEPSGIYPHGSKFAPLGDAVKEVFATGKAYGVPAVRTGALPFQPVVDEFYTLLFSEHAEMLRAGQWWAQRMLATPRPFQEKLTLFWHGHFATSQEKVMDQVLMLAQIETLRRLANGNFRELLVAMAQDPAMLVWLDNRENVKGRPNENFAREIMELFCMGEGQGYSETDIRELARAFTGWTLRPIKTTKDAARFVDDPALHDGGVKTFLGETGRFGGDEAIRIILNQPATPRFITRKIYRAFVRDDLSPELNDRLAQLLVKSDYELKPLLRAIFLSRDFYATPSVGTQIKSPIHYLVSTWRKLGLRTLPTMPDFTEAAGALGQVPFYPPNVAGWAGGRSWINPATLLTRGNYVHALLFPEPATFVAPDKVVLEGYRHIPEMFPQYGVQPSLWNRETKRMEPVSMKRYREFLDGIGSGSGPATAAALPESMAMNGGETKSKMSELADSEWFNLAVGVYTGIVEAFNRVKPVPRSPTGIDFTAMLHNAKAQTAEEAVDHFCRRFLSVPLSPERRAAIHDQLWSELGSEQLDFADPRLPDALRRAVHLVLSSPEYQVG